MSTMVAEPEPEAAPIASKETEEVFEVDVAAKCLQVDGVVSMDHMHTHPVVHDVKTEVEEDSDITRDISEASQPNSVAIGPEPDGHESESETKAEKLESEHDEEAETEASGVVLRSKRTRKLPKPKDIYETVDAEIDSRRSVSRPRPSHAFKSKAANKQMLTKKRNHLWSRMPHRKYTRSTGSVLALRKKQQEVSSKKSQQGTKCKKTIHEQLLKMKATQSYGYLRLPERTIRSKQSIVTRSMKLQLLMENLEDMKRIEVQNLKNVKKLCNNALRRTVAVSEVVNPQIQQIVKSTVTQCEEVIRRIDRLVFTMRRLQHHGIRLCSKLKFVPGHTKSSGRNTKVAEIRKKFVEQLCINN